MICDAIPISFYFPLSFHFSSKLFIFSLQLLLLALVLSVNYVFHIFAPILEKLNLIFEFFDTPLSLLQSFVNYGFYWQGDILLCRL
jgi:hypothetical protein